MQDLTTILSTVHRPRLLVRAARLGVREYDRQRHLHRLLGYGTLPRPAAAILRLVELERDLDTQRREDDAGYSIARHLDVLIALIGEARLYRTVL